jgi:hypothetical protein
MGRSSMDGSLDVSRDFVFKGISHRSDPVARAKLALQTAYLEIDGAYNRYDRGPTLQSSLECVQGELTRLSRENARLRSALAWER